MTASKPVIDLGADVFTDWKARSCKARLMASLPVSGEIVGACPG